MSPIITHEDELDLAKYEKQLSSHLKKVAKWQRAVADSQKKLADNIAKLNIERQLLNRTFRDVLKQMQTLARESRSNVKDEEVNFYQDFIHKNDQFIEANTKYINAIKDIAVRKEDLAARGDLFSKALIEVAGRRSGLIKKALSIEKTKNKMIEGSKLTMLENELNDLQRDFDRARNILLKEIEQFLQTQSELNDLWLKMKETTSKMS
ncbi:MAG: hypothetical protein EU532_02340 [Promethearchaeota archaeon]|nr:MAG: hypothetical protein EU532_02340 [Candidatus Lokiarchaeota archaeon]